MREANLALLNLTMNSKGEQKLIHPTLIWDENDAVLIDTGTPGQLQSIIEEMKRIGIPFHRLTKIILTHQDYDHIGSLHEVLAASGHKVEVLAHPLTKPYVEGEKHPVKLDPSITPPKVGVDSVIDEGEVLPICGGISVIFTPGHTPDHISLYHHPTKTLIAGDATISADGRMLGPNPQYTLDMKGAVQSLGKFSAYDIEKVICYHGGICEDNVKERLEELAGVVVE